MFNFDFRLRRRFPELQLRTHEFHEDDCEDGNHQHFGNDCESMTPPAEHNEDHQEGPATTTERGFFLSSLAAQCGQASHLHRSTFRKNGVATSWLQTGHFAMGNTPFRPYCAVVLPPRQWN